MNPEEKNRIVADATSLLGFAKKPDAMESLVARMDEITTLVQREVQAKIGGSPVYNRDRIMHLITDTYLSNMNRFNREELEVLFASFMAATAIRNIS